jgi:hypothetical protein
MASSKVASLVVLVIGIGLLAVSLLANVLGIGDSPGFGRQQTLGTITGAAISGVGLFLVRKSRKSVAS